MPKKKGTRAAVDSTLPPSDAESTFMLRTCAPNLTSYGGFQWPASGHVKALSWNPAPVCGYGLHGLLHGVGNQSLLNVQNEVSWLVVRVRRVDVVEVTELGGGKVKVPEAWVEFSGSLSGAIERLLALDVEAVRSSLPGYQATVQGEKCQSTAHAAASQAASSGDASQAASSGDASQAASSGDASQAASSGTRSQAASSGDASQAASSGYASQAASSGDASQAASSGTRSQAASSGTRSQAASSGTRSQAASSGTRSQAASSGTRSQAASSGTRSQAASSGYASQAASSGDASQAASSGTRSQAASSGDASQAASSGYASQAASSGDASQAASSGTRSQAASSGTRSQAASSGDASQAASSGTRTRSTVAGDRARAKAGELGLLLLFKYDAVAERERVVVAYVGENDIKADTWYRIGSTGDVEEALDDEYDRFEADQCAAAARKLDADKIIASLKPTAKTEVAS